jgi:Zn-dependent peptidase ImmA (M78 family)
VLAAEILMPATLLLGAPAIANRARDHVWTVAELVDAARPYGVSAEALLLRLVALDRTSRDAYERFRQSATEPERRGNRAAGGNFYATKARDLGKGYVRAVTGAHRSGLLDTNTATAYLGVKVGQIPRLAAAAGT